MPDVSQTIEERFIGTVNKIVREAMLGQMPPDPVAKLQPGMGSGFYTPDMLQAELMQALADLPGQWDGKNPYTVLTADQKVMLQGVTDGVANYSQWLSAGKPAFV